MTVHCPFKNLCTGPEVLVSSLQYFSQVQSQSIRNIFPHLLWFPPSLTLTPGASVINPVGTMAQYEEVNVRGYEEFCNAVSQRKGKDIFVYFSGDKDAQGRSWCPDCVTAEPVVRGEMSHLPEGSVFIYCQVGERAYWKDPSNDFKKTLKLSGVPTLLRYGTPQKLVEDECFKSELVRMMFTED